METSADFSQQCSSCDVSSARCWCVDCNEALCDVCVSAHRRVTLTRTHRILNQPPAGDVSTPPTKFCRLHPSEPLQLFCFTCNQLTCRDCQLTAHMNHRYQFYKEGLETLKKSVEKLVRPIRACRDTGRRSLQDMADRLQDLSDMESELKIQLQQSYKVIIQQLRTRMEELLKDAQRLSASESDQIRRRMQKLELLQQNQQLVIEIAEKAKVTNDLSSLMTYKAEIESKLKLLDQDSSPPQTMCQLVVFTDQPSLQSIFNFGRLEVKWIPFAVSRTSDQNSPAVSTSPAPTSGPLPQTRTTLDSLVPVNSASSLSKSSSDRFSPLSPNAPVTTAAAAPSTQTVQRLSPLPHLEKNQIRMLVPVSNSVNPEPLSFCLPQQSGPPLVLKLVQSSVQPPDSRQKQSSSALMTNTQTVYQVSCVTLPSVLPQFPTLLSQTSAANTRPKQQESLKGHVLPGRFRYSSPIFPAATKGNQTSVGPSHTALPSQTQQSKHQPLKDISSITTCIPPSSVQHLTPDVVPHSSSLKHLQSLVVRAMADSPCGGSVQQVASRRKEPTENEPTSTMSEEPAPAGEPSASGVSDPEAKEPEPEVLDAEPEPEVLDSEAEESEDSGDEPEPEVLDAEAEEPEPEVLDAEPETEVSDAEAEEPEPEVLDAEPETEVSDAEPETEVSDAEPEPEVLDREAEEPEVWDAEREPEVLDAEPETEVSDAEPEPEVLDREAEEPETEVLDAEREPEVSDGEAEEPETEVLDAEREPEVLDREAEEPETEVLDAEREPEVSDGEAETEILDAEPEAEVLDAEREPEVSDGEAETEVLDAEPEAEVLDREAEEPSSVIGHTDSSPSQWQPRVSLVRLPVSRPRPERSLPCFRLVPGDAEDDIYLEEMSEDSQSHGDDVTDDIPELSSPESPATLLILSCSACRHANASIICEACGRGFHRHCHEPPVGQDVWSEWICSRCQEPPEPPEPPDAISSHTTNKQQQTPRDNVEGLSSELLPSVLTSARRDTLRSAANMADGRLNGSEVTSEEREVTTYESKLKETRKRLRDALQETSRYKRTRLED